MDVLEEHNYAKVPVVAESEISNLLPDFDMSFGERVENDVWLPLGDLNVDVGELLQISPSENDAAAASFFPFVDDTLAVPIVSKGSPISDAGYDSTGTGSPESSGSDSETGPAGIEQPSSLLWPNDIDFDLLLGDLEGKGTLDLSSSPVDVKPPVHMTASLGETQGSAFLNDTASQEYLSPTPSLERRKRTAQHHSDRISGPTAFLGNAVCWDSGLQLTEEEKETLLSDGCSVPTSLPLTAEEEKALKLARRKIKNKISAQESRRKKKEFIDSMQQRAEVSERENRRLQQRVVDLEKKNLALLDELKALKQDVARRHGPAISPSSSSHITLLILAVCFAFAFPTMWGSSFSSMWLPATTKVAVSGPAVEQPAFDYTMTNFRSRTLKQFSDDDRHDDFNGSGGGSLPDDNVGIAVDWLAASSAKPYISLEESSNQAHFVDSAAVVVPENITVSTPA